MLGFTNMVSKIAKTPRAAQFACMCVGILIFFDDYANLLLTGETMKPLTDILFVSREKLSFIVDSTSAPIASISPISSWVGFEAGLVQEAIDKLKERNGGEELTIPGTGFAVFLQSIRYSYYSLFMIGLIAMLIATQRDYGPMLIAERKVRVYDRTDGGPGAASGGKSEHSKQNEPKEDQPLLMHNLLLPIVVWIILVFVILVNSGTVAGEDQSFIDKIEGGDSYVALLYGTMGTVWITMILYLLQITIPGTGKLALPTPLLLMDMLPWRKTVVEERGDQQPRFLMTVNESIEGFLHGMARIFLGIVILVRGYLV
jgi:Na+/H+ antiporter NhaC